ncbi:zinc-ribbon domain-containing protein [Rubrobacter tropicus]|uniref:Zinc-ribbon domain-containing protein n=1 Tax=Rubrobacter tropicus TaxID=2653851 RepID=A0A6G8Q8F6_9ACTN|nr:zinc-ribbon domain-containing protein [Rubrobacter tropicus]QIN82756.1 zinc-ribbon domain-containing protein [Rubrobacter tropicus]
MANRYCSNCGQELNEDSRFCPNCGRPVHETAHVPTPEADVPVPPPPVTQRFDTATQDASQERTSGGSDRVRGAWGWFLARPVRTKVLLGFAVLVVALILSPLWEVVARLALLVSVVALIWCLLRRRPASTWGIAVIAAFVSMYAFGGVSNALYSETSGQTKPTGAASSDQANADRPKREAEEAPREVRSTEEGAEQKDPEDRGAGATGSEEEGASESEKPESNPGTEPATKPSADGEGDAPSGQAPQVKSPPPTAEEQLYAKIAGVFLLEGKPAKEMAEHVKGREFRPSQADGLKQVDITPESQGCRYVNVEFYEQAAEFMEFNMEEVYASVYKNEELSQSVCNVQVSAFQELQNDYGQTFSRRVYVTSMDKTTANKVGDWLMVEQPAIWTVNKMHPVVEAELAQNAVEHAADCAEDEGIFDMQPLDCP